MNSARVKVRLKSVKAEALLGRRPFATIGYDAASTSPRLSKWTWNGSGPNDVLSSGIVQLRGRSRDSDRRDGTAHSGIDVLVSNIIGTGIKPQWNTKNTDFNRMMGDLFMQWVDVADADGRYDFYGQQMAACRSMLVAGDVFGRVRVRRLSDGYPVPMQVQLLESEFCPHDKNEVFQGGYIQSGVEFNGIGQRTAYWLYRDHPNDNVLRSALGNAIPVPVPASEVIHMAANGGRIGQIRGEPWMARALIKLYDLDKFDDAVLLRQQIANMFAGFITPDANSRFAWQEDADEGGTALATLEPGLMQVLQPGDTINFADPPENGAGYGEFMNVQDRRVATSLGILYEQLSGDFSKINDRTWRAAFNGFARKVEQWQHHIVVFQFCSPIIYRWVELGIMSGAIKLPADVKFWQAVRPKWLPQAWPYINPEQDINAKVAAIKGGLKSRKATVSEAGDDIVETDEEIAEDNAREEDKGLLFNSNMRLEQQQAEQQAQAADRSHEIAMEAAKQKPPAPKPSGE